MTIDISQVKLSGLEFFAEALQYCNTNSDNVLDAEDSALFEDSSRVSEIIGGGTESVLYNCVQERLSEERAREEVVHLSSALQETLDWFKTDGKQIPDGPYVVTVWSHKGAEFETTRQVIDAFNQAHQGDVIASLKFISESGTEYHDAVYQGKQAGTLPDVLDLDGPLVSEYVDSDILQPIGDLVSPRMREDFLPSIIDQGTVRGELYALGAFDSGLALMYNKAIVTPEFLATNGISLPSKGEAWNWNEFVGVLQAVQAANPDGTAVSFNYGWDAGEWPTYAVLPMLWSMGQDALSPEGLATGYLDSPKAIEALTKFQRLITSPLSTTEANNSDAFAAGEAAFTWGGHWMVSSYQEKGIDIGIMPLPYMGNPDDRATGAGTWCWGLTDAPETTDRQYAAQVFDWLLSSKETVAPMVEANHAIPARQSALEQQDLDPSQRAIQDVFFNQLQEYGHVRPRTPYYSIFTRNFAEAIQQIATGADVATVLKAAAANIDAEIAAQE